MPQPQTTRAGCASTMTNPGLSPQTWQTRYDTITELYYRLLCCRWLCWLTKALFWSGFLLCSANKLSCIRIIPVMYNFSRISILRFTIGNFTVELKIRVMRHYPRCNRIVALHLIGAQCLKLYLQISTFVRSFKVKLEWHSCFDCDRIRLVERRTISRTDARKFCVMGICEWNLVNRLSD